MSSHSDSNNSTPSPPRQEWWNTQNNQVKFPELKASDGSEPLYASNPTLDYDYIIAGAGAAGLSLLVRMIGYGKFTHKRILLVDKDLKTQNDRTWCFWERGEGLFEKVVFKSWKKLRFHSNNLPAQTGRKTGYSASFDISPYQYKMIRGIDFYEYCLGIISMEPNVTVQHGLITEMQSDGNCTWILLNGRKYTAEYIFNSIIFSKPVLNKTQYYLLQHFKGWVIETATPVFNEKEATLMDFRVSQQKGTTFAYVMPFSSKSALVEYTLFSKDLLHPREYDIALHEYITENLKCSSYTVASQEFGSIPMTNYNFPRQQSNIINLGTAGGQTKSSSGYTFQFIQKHTALLVDNLQKGGPLVNPPPSKKFGFYDSVLLNVLATAKMPGDKVFTHLFRKNPSNRIFRFLDNESSLSEEIQLIASLPTLPFLKAAMEQVFYPSR